MQYAEFTKGVNGNPDSWHLYNHVYEINVYLVIGQREKCYKTFKSLENHTLKRGCVFPNSVDNPVIWLESKDMLDCLAHECVHACNFIMRNAGVEPDFYNDEAYAYLMSWMFRGFYFAAK